MEGGRLWPSAGSTYYAALNDLKAISSALPLSVEQANAQGFEPVSFDKSVWAVVDPATGTIGRFASNEGLRREALISIPGPRRLRVIR